MKNSIVGKMVKTSAFHPTLANIIGVVISESRATVVIQPEVGGCFTVSKSGLVVVDNGAQKHHSTPLDDVIKLLKRRNTVILVDGLDTHFIKQSRKEIIDLINNPHTYRVTVQHANGNIKGIYSRGDFYIARQLLLGKKDYVWVICGGAIE
jgi:hypothetical protein